MICIAEPTQRLSQSNDSSPHLTWTVLVAEPQSPLAEWQNGRRGSAMYISAGRTPCTLGKTFFEGGFGLLGTRRVSSHQEIPKKNFLKY